MRTRIKHVPPRILDFIQLNSRYDTFDVPVALTTPSGDGMLLIRHKRNKIFKLIVPRSKYSWRSFFYSIQSNYDLELIVYDFTDV